MTLRNFLFTSSVLISMMISEGSYAQLVVADSSSQQNALNTAVTLLNVAVGDQSQLYNGPEYYSYDPNIKSNPYFMDVNTFTQGSVFYNGAVYNGVQMLYDLYSDEVAVLLFNHFSKFSLVKEKVRDFDFLGHHFVNINADTIPNNTVIKSGYYDQLYKGKMEVLVKRVKTIQNNTNITVGVESFFTPPTRNLYLRKNNVYYSITSQGSLLNVLKDRKKDLQRFIKSGQIKFKNDPEDAIVKISSYYDHLTN